MIRETKNVSKNKIYRYKLGRTNNLKHRMQVYNTGSSDNIDLIYFEEVVEHKLIEKCIKHGLKDYVYRGKKEFYECSLLKIKNMIKECINFHKSKLKRQNNGKIIQIQFSYIKKGIDPGKMLQIKLEKYDLNKDTKDNEYNKDWSSDDVNIFSDATLSFESDDEQKGGSKTINFLFMYNYNKNKYIDLVNLHVK